MVKNPLVINSTGRAAGFKKAATPGAAGFDNIRENIDPHVKTKVLDTKELIQNGVSYDLSTLGGTPPGGADTNIQYNNSGAFGGVTDFNFDGTDLYLKEDNFKIYFGAGQDASIYYDGTNFIIDPKEAGAGNLEVAGDLDLGANDLTTTGDITCGTLNYTTLNPPITGCSFGTDNQIPYTNSSADDFDYSSKLTFDGNTLDIVSAAAKSIDLTRTLSSRVTSQRTLQINDTLTWTGGATSCYAIAAELDDRRVVNSGFVDTLVGLNFPIYKTGSTTASNVITYSGYYEISDSTEYKAAYDTTTTFNAFFAQGICNPKINLTAGRTLTYNYVFFDAEANTNNPTLTSGTPTQHTYMYRARSTNDLQSTFTNNVYSFYTNVEGGTANWAFYNDSTTANNLLGKDNIKTYFGTGNDASIYYDGTDIIINSDDVGSGGCKINSLNIRADGTIQPVAMADASAPNDSIYYSTTASKLVYKDSGGSVNNLY